MSDKKNRQSPDNKQTGPGQDEIKSIRQDRANIKNFDNGVGSRSDSTKND